MNLNDRSVLDVITEVAGWNWMDGGPSTILFKTSSGDYRIEVPHSSDIEVQSYLRDVGLDVAPWDEWELGDGQLTVQCRDWTCRST